MPCLRSNSSRRGTHMQVSWASYECRSNLHFHGERRGRVQFYCSETSTACRSVGEFLKHERTTLFTRSEVTLGARSYKIRTPIGARSSLHSLLRLLPWRLQN